MRRNRQKNKVTDIYFIINKNLETNWLTSFLSGLLFFINLFVGISYGFGFIHDINSAPNIKTIFWFS